MTETTGATHATEETNRDLSSVSVGELMGAVSRDLSALMRQELQLATAELKEEARTTGKGAGMLGAAGFAFYMVLLFASLAAWWGLANVMDEGLAALLVALVWLVVAAVLAPLGRAKLRQVHPRPERTMETLKDMPSALAGR